MEVQPFNKAEIQAFRAETAGTAERIHLNNAGASLPPDIVVNTMVDFLREEALYGGYETEAKYRVQYEPERAGWHRTRICALLQYGTRN